MKLLPQWRLAWKMHSNWLLGAAIGLQGWLAKLPDTEEGIASSLPDWLGVIVPPHILPWLPPVLTAAAIIARFIPQRKLQVEAQEKGLVP